MSAQVIHLRHERVRRALRCAERCLNEAPKADPETAAVLQRAAAKYRDLAEQIMRGAA